MVQMLPRAQTKEHQENTIFFMDSSLNDNITVTKICYYEERYHANFISLTYSGKKKVCRNKMLITGQLLLSMSLC